jgi:hypothetical protein
LKIAESLSGTHSGSSKQNPDISLQAPKIKNSDFVGFHPDKLPHCLKNFVKL